MSFTLQAETGNKGTDIAPCSAMSRRTLHTAVATVATALLLVAPLTAAPKRGQAAHGRHAKLDSQLQQALDKAPKPQRVIVRVKPGHEGALKKALAAHGDVVESQHAGLGTLTVVLHGEDLEPLAGDPAVLSVSSDARVRVQAAKGKAKGQARGQAKTNDGDVSDVADPQEASGRGRNVKGEATGLIRALQGLTPTDPKGHGVGVAVIDSGIEDSNFFGGRIWWFFDFTRGGIETAPYDDFGHGTHVASLIGGAGQKSGNYQGMAPMVHLIGLKVLDRYGNGRTSDVIDAIMFAADNRHQLGIDVINLSLGHPIFESAGTDPLVHAVEYAAKQGIVVVASAGNFGMDPETHEVGYGGLTSPGNAPSAITVGAADTKGTLGRGDDRVAPFSSRGPSWIDGFAKPDLVAPGVGISGKAVKDAELYVLYSDLMISEDEDPLGGGAFSRLSGTSMAAAEASGLVALMLTANASLAPKTVKAILEYTATPLVDDGGMPYDRLTQGAGEINGRGALDMALATDTSMPLGTPWVDTSQLSGATDYDGVLAAWRENIVWGNYLIDGASLLVHSEAWDDENIVWGSFSRTDDNIVWGNFSRDLDDNIVWGNLAIWGSLADDEQDNIVWGNFFRYDENIVWGNFTRDADDNIVWGNVFWDDNIVWGNSLIGEADGDNIVWGNLADFDGDNIVWGNLADENIVWGNATRDDDDNIVWGNSDTVSGYSLYVMSMR